MAKLVVVRIRGCIGVDKRIEDTLRMLGLKRRFSVAVLEDTPPTRGMLNAATGYIAWGESTSDLENKLKNLSGLKSPRKGLKAIKQPWPRGDAGYRGAKIGEFIEKML